MYKYCHSDYEACVVPCKRLAFPLLHLLIKYYQVNKVIHAKSFAIKTIYELTGLVLLTSHRANFHKSNLRNDYENKDYSLAGYHL